jgi:hypothetical protein
VHTIAVVTSPMSVHTLRIQKKKSFPHPRIYEGCSSEDEEYVRTEVRSPYLASFWTVASLYRRVMLVYVRGMIGIRGHDAPVRWRSVLTNSPSS